MAISELAALYPADPRRLGGYEVVGRLGQGGMGTVYAGRAADGRTVAIKVIRAEFAHDPTFRGRFRREAANAQRVAGFCTARVLAADAEADPPYLVTEYVDGPTLAEVVRADGPLSPANLEGVAVGVAAALAAIHGAGVVHRDLKPSNVLLSLYGPRVIDFGIARALDSLGGLSQDVGLLGTPAFMSPEQVRGDPVDTAADVYGWGGLVCYAGTGRYPFGAGPPEALAYRAVHAEPELDGLDPRLRSIVAETMRKEPYRRPTARELLALLLPERGPGVATATAVTDILGRWDPPEPLGSAAALPDPAALPEPTALPEPAVGPEPAAVPEPTAAPEPTVGPEPAALPDPTAAPEPTVGPEPAALPEPAVGSEPAVGEAAAVAEQPATAPGWRPARRTTPAGGGRPHRRPRPRSERPTSAYLGSPKNLAGSTAALGGVALTLTGVVGAPEWPFVVAALYAIGALVAPAPRRGHAIPAPPEPAEIRARLDAAERALADDLPPPVATAYRRVTATLRDLLDRPERLPAGSPEAFLVERTALDYLPTAVEAYLRLPRAYADSEVVSDGRTAREVLLDQLALLASGMAEVVEAAAWGDSQRLLAHGRFLADRFGAAPADLRPPDPP